MADAGALPAARAAKSAWDAFFSTDFGVGVATALGDLAFTAVVIVVALIVRLIAQRAIRIFVNRVVSGVKKRQQVDDTQALLASPVSAVRTVQRTRTLGSVLNNVVSVVIVIVAALSIVFKIAPEITGAFSLITAALGAGLGFGAQNIVKDVLTGLFMVGDDQLGVGDIVTTDLATGVVEAVGIRITQIRDVNGVLWYVRNGELTRVGNMSQGWSRAVVDVTVPKDADVDAVQQRLGDTARALLSDPEWRAVVTEEPEVWGLESVTADGVVLRVVVKTRSNARDDVAWALRTHLREALDAAGEPAALMTSEPIASFEQVGALRGIRPPGMPAAAARIAKRTIRARAAVQDDAPAAPARPRASRAAAGARGAAGAGGATGRAGAGAPDDGSDG